MQSSASKAPVINPWTNKVKVKGQGLLNSIMNKYLNEDQEPTKQNMMTKDQVEYLRLAKQIQNVYKPNNKIQENMLSLFRLKNKCAKIDQLLTWIQKVNLKSQPKSQTENEKNQEQKQANKLVPIDSSFIYLPLHSGTVFHEILKDCSNALTQRGIGQYKNPKIKQLLQEINKTQSYAALIQKSIL